MSQAGSTSSGGGSSSVTLRPNSGGDLSGSVFPVLGYPAGASQVIETYKVGSNIEVADQSYITRYVVDQSTTPGYKGTYSTIQAAVNQAIADGYTYTNMAMAEIWLRQGAYGEDVTIPDDACVCLRAMVPAQGFDSYDVYFGGNLRFTGDPLNGLVFVAKDIFFQSDATHNVQFDAYVVQAWFHNCCFSGQDVVIVQSPDQLNFYNCDFYCNITDASLVASQVKFFNSKCNGTLSNAAAWEVHNGLWEYGTCNDTSSILICNSYGIDGANQISGTTTSDCYAFGVATTWGGASGAAVPLFNTHGKVFVSNYSYKMDPASVQSTRSVQGPDCDVHFMPTLAGNIIKSRSVATSYTAVFDDYYIGVSDTSSPWTISLPSNPVCDGLYIVKDESMLAGTHNITIDVNGSTGTIDGAASTAITTNGGCIHFKADSVGINYFII